MPRTANVFPEQAWIPYLTIHYKLAKQGAKFSKSGKLAPMTADDVAAARTKAAVTNGRHSPQVFAGGVIARRPVRIGPVRSFVGVKYARAGHSAVTIAPFGVVEMLRNFQNWKGSNSRLCDSRPRSNGHQSFRPKKIGPISLAFGNRNKRHRLDHRRCPAFV
jgi:hypothetical protein